MGGHLTIDRLGLCYHHVHSGQKLRLIKRTVFDQTVSYCIDCHKQSIEFFVKKLFVFVHATILLL